MAGRSESDRAPSAESEDAPLVTPTEATAVADPSSWDALRRDLSGELRLDEAQRYLYATDASIYSETPRGVARPANRDDLVRLVRFAREANVPLIPRAGGTSLAGQCVGDGLVVDVGRHMTAIVDLDGEGRAVVVQPGVIQDELNAYLKPHAYVFGPDTSTGNRAMIGGMIGNNSCGSRSILYGTTREHVHSLEAILDDGSLVTLSEWDAQATQAALARDDRLGEITRGMRDILVEYRDVLRDHLPHPEVRRRNTGYALDILLDSALLPDGVEPVDFARFLCGSEGTLALVSEAALKVSPHPAASGVVVAQFDTIRKSLEATALAVQHNPSAVELIDKKLLDLTVDQIEHKDNRFFLRGDPEAVLIVEVFRDSEAEVAASLSAIRDHLMGEGRAYACVDIAPDEVARIWSLRKAGLGLLMGMPGDAKPVAFVEDTAVRVGDLPDFIDAFDAVMRKYDADCVYYGHASVGELHMRPILDLKQPGDVERLDQIAKEIADLVREYRGSLSGEHGDGRVRSPYIERVMGAECVRAFEAVKRVWDPNGLFNPGKIVHPAPVAANLRTARLQGSRALTDEVETVGRFGQDTGLRQHLERCNGAGVCRRLPIAGGTMCPSYQVTREEEHSTRGRSNLFRQLLYHREPAKALASPELYDALSLCLSCKGCKRECPASVDMAKLKSEFMQHYWDSHRTPLRVKAVGHIASINRLGTLTPRLTNFIMRGPLSRGLLKRFLGFHPDVPLPALSRRTVKRWFKRRGPVARPTETVGRVAVFVDEFTDAHDLAVGRAAIELLEALGYEVVIPAHTDSGRPLISKGLMRAAKKRAERNVEALFALADEGIPIIGLEPSAALTLVDEYPDLVPEGLRSKAQIVAAQTMLLEDFLARAAETRDLRPYFDTQPRTIHLHGHCHQKALVTTAGAEAALGIPENHEVLTIPSGCCGMAGAFGYEKEHYEVSQAVAELVLLPYIRKVPDEHFIVGSGFSCRHQVVNALGREVLHPAQILRQALVGSPLATR